MCGIAGFIDKKNRLSKDERLSLLHRMLDSIEHRGKEDRGTFIDGPINLGHTRLKIIDLSNNGHQPMESPEAVLTFNGEIYNHQEIRASLLKSLQSTSDTETLFHAWNTWGESSLDMLRGMFSIAVFNKKKLELSLIVDRFGIKPLYYLDTPDVFAWSSEIKSFHALPNFTFNLNKEVLYEHLAFRSIAGKETLLEKVNKMLPGQLLIFDLKQDAEKTKYYWHLPENPQGPSDIKELLHASVKEHLLSDVPYGVQLSGGLDSSLIGSIIKAQTSSPFHSFSIGLADPAWNEFKYSQEVAGILETQHHEILFSEAGFCDNLLLATYHHDEPINHPNTVPMLLLARAARPFVKVLLSGEGADEIFGGYKRYLPLHQGEITSDSLLMSNSFNSPELLSRVTHGLEKNLDYRSSLVQKVKNYPTLYQLSYYDLLTYLPSILLRQDKMSMAANIETRVPFLDHRLVEAALFLAPEEKISNHESKNLLKKIGVDFLPSHIIYRDKCGFGLPIAQWLRNSTGLGKALTALKKQKYDFLNYGFLENVIDQHIAHQNDFSNILWPLISFDMWHRTFIEGEGF
jgi:asparagine synthase (glutamine-hydrolysing)